MNKNKKIHRVDHVKIEDGTDIFLDNVTEVSIGDVVTGYVPNITSLKCISKAKSEQKTGKIIEIEPMLSPSVFHFYDLSLAIHRAKFYSDYDRLIEEFEKENPFVLSNHRARNYLLKVMRRELNTRGRPSRSEEELEIEALIALDIQLLKFAGYPVANSPDLSCNDSASRIVGKAYNKSESAAYKIYRHYLKKRANKKNVILLKVIRKIIDEDITLDKEKHLFMEKYMKGSLTDKTLFYMDLNKLRIYINHS